MHLIKVGKLKGFKKVSSYLKTILMTDLADLQIWVLSSFEKGETCFEYMQFIYNLSLYNVYFYFNACCNGLKSLGIHCLHYALFLFVLETNFKIKHLVPNYSHTYKAEDKTSLLIKRYNITQLCILYIIVSLLSCHATLLALHDKTNNGCERDNNNIYSLLF